MMLARQSSCRSRCHVICESEKREERKTVSCLSVRRGGIPRKQGLYLGQKPMAKRGGNPCLSDLCKSGSNEQDAEVGWPTRLRRISAIRSKRLDAYLGASRLSMRRMASPGRRMSRSRYRAGTFPSQSGLVKFQRRVASSRVSPNSALSQSLELHSTR